MSKYGVHLKLSLFLEAASKAVIAIPILYRGKQSEKTVLNDEVIASVVPPSQWRTMHTFKHQEFIDMNLHSFDVEPGAVIASLRSNPFYSIR